MSATLQKRILIARVDCRGSVFIVCTIVQSAALFCEALDTIIVGANKNESSCNMPISFCGCVGFVNGFNGVSE